MRLSAILASFGCRLSIRFITLNPLKELQTEYDANTEHDSTLDQSKYHVVL
jgi:hypothetical protein